jgi:hypothetical protein
LFFACVCKNIFMYMNYFYSGFWGLFLVGHVFM